MTKRGVSLDQALVDELSLPESDIRVMQLRVSPEQFEKRAEAVVQVLRRFQDEREEGELKEWADPGVWTWTRAGDVIAIDVLDCDRPLETVRELAHDLEELGISGRLEPRDPSVIEPLPLGAYVLEARLHVGEGVREEDTLRWRTSSESYRRVLSAAVAWCVGKDHRPELFFKKGVLDPFVLDVGEDPIARLYDERGDDPQLWVRSGEETRLVATKAQLSQVSLIALLTPEDGGVPWQRPYDAIKDVIRSCEAEIAYAFVKHGEKAQMAAHGRSLFLDWPPRPGFDLQAGSFGTAILQDDRAAPDAFALQALGPGYGARDLSFSSYTAEQVGRITLLEHRDPAAWFGHAFVPRGTRWDELEGIPVPKVLADARAELDPILIGAVEIGKKLRLGPEGLPLGGPF